MKTEFSTSGEAVSIHIEGTATTADEIFALSTQLHRIQELLATQHRYAEDIVKFQKSAVEKKKGFFNFAKGVC